MFANSHAVIRFTCMLNDVMPAMLLVENAGLFCDMQTFGRISL